MSASRLFAPVSPRKPTVAKRPDPDNSEAPYLKPSDDPELRSVLASQHITEALIALDWPVEPRGDEFETWKLGNLIHMAIKPFAHAV